MPKKRSKRGYFFSFEGGEGSGKSTQARRLFGWLQDRGIDAILTREPGGTALGNHIRSLLLDKLPMHPSRRAELLLYQADRAQHVEEKIRPAIEAGKVVISDRYCDSSTVYQGLCRNLGMEAVEALNRFATGGLFPDTVLLLDISAEAGMARVRKRTKQSLDRIESEELAFHKMVRKGFLKLARRTPSRYVILDGDSGELELQGAIQKIAQIRLKRRGLWKD